jgi:gliding motility-associated lipoprotein GldH
MNRVLILFFIPALTAILLSSVGCTTDPKAVIDQNTPVINRNWSYLERFGYDVKIDDERSLYNLYMNLRVTADYKYSNLFVLISQTGPNKKRIVKRYELKLANKYGEWLGAGSGNLYSYQVSFLTDYKFPAKGVYRFEIEQNMRDNPLRDVNDVGLRVEKAAP